jgi:hypothetical protein
MLTRKVNAQQTATQVATPLALPVPAELSETKTADELKEVRTAADEAYKSADDLLDNVSSGSGGPKVTAAANIARAIVNAGWSQLAATAGDTTQATARMASAVQYQKAASDDPSSATVPAYLMMLTNTVPTSTLAPAPTTAPAAAPEPAPATSAPTNPGGVFNTTP